MGRQSQEGCGGLLAIGAVVFLISRCSGGGPTPAPTPYTSTAPAPTATSLGADRYVSTPALSCRSSRSSRARRVALFSMSDHVAVETTEGTWSRVSSPNGSCWVRTAALSTSPVSADAESASGLYSLPERRRRGAAPSAAAFQCGAKRVCGQMDSCAEANYYLRQCGLSRLDGDGDGVPCESIC